jgi:hypothetical protein
VVVELVARMTVQLIQPRVLPILAVVVVDKLLDFTQLLRAVQAL